jgi:hypothetical protein
MSTDAASVVAGDIRRPAAKARAGSSFFFGMSVLLLGFVLFGFAPTFYLRAFFPTPPIPPYLYLHGAVLSAWFAWFVSQTWLVRTGRTPRHRRMGVVGAIIAAVVVVVGPMASFGLISRMRAAGLAWDADMGPLIDPQLHGVKMLDLFSGVVWINFISIAIFALLVTAAVLLRGRPQAHKRLMLLASITIITPALGRIARTPHLGGEAGPFMPIVLLALLLAVIAHDVFTRRRLHPATACGVGLIVAGVVMQQFFSTSEWGKLVVQNMA